MQLQDLEQALVGQRPASTGLSDAPDCERVTFDGSEPDNAQWKALMEIWLRTAKTFEIHCWNEEAAELALALQFGTVEPFEWQHGTVVAGSVTAAFSDWLVGLPKPEDTEIYHKMTPFFTVALDNGFSSEHYGTELAVPRAR